MNRIALLAVCLTGCATTPPAPEVLGCQTACGMFAPLATARQCIALQAFERTALRQFAADVPGWTPDRTCPALDRFTVMPWPYVGARGVMLGASENPITGRTFLERRVIFLDSQVWGDSPLAHEMAHVISWKLERDSTHARWTERGICHAINFASDHFHCDYAAPYQGWNL